MRWVARTVLAVLLQGATTTLAIPPKVPAAPAKPIVTRDDVCLAWAINDEARGEPAKGQKAVYDVIKHRMEARNLTACEVVKQPKQFSGYRRGMKLEADEAMLQRLKEVRKMPPVVPNASYFHSKKAKPLWAAKMKKVLTVGLHVFYMQPKPLHKELQKEKK